MKIWTFTVNMDEFYPPWVDVNEKSLLDFVEEALSTRSGIAKYATWTPEPEFRQLRLL